jgi:HAD superfamily hydrolase (TIGR01549 family)
MASSAAAPSPRRPVVLVDLDDTLFDHALTCRAAIGELRHEWSFLRRRSLDDLWRDYQRQLEGDGRTITPSRGAKDRARRERWQRLAAGCGVPASERMASELTNGYRRHYHRLQRAVPGARDLLARLRRQAPVVVVTNNEVAGQEEKVRFLGIGPYLDALVVSEAVGVGKPDRRIFDAALAEVDARPQDAAMLGDSWTNDVVGARNAGIRPVWFNRFGLDRPGRRRVEELRALRPVARAERLLLRRPPPRPDRGRTRRL